MVKSLIRRCPSCKTYTLKEVCPRCGSKTVSAAPPRFSPVDKYVRYRLMSKGLIEEPKPTERASATNHPSS
ncbi:MAG: RNA-protein complex protein Nop10 [Desulfurococcaceae archaeon]|nr:RNA-protein complex protein Nop10 [Desulfurococcaceae archaeon]